jgi:DNA polymerase theta
MFSRPELLAKTGFSHVPEFEVRDSISGLDPYPRNPKQAFHIDLPEPPPKRLKEAVAIPVALVKAAAAATETATPVRDASLHFNFRRWNMSPNIVNIYKTKKITHFYDWQLDCLDIQLKKSGNLLYSLPTSSGKTLVAEVMLLRCLTNQKKKALFILPFVALIHEKAKALRDFGRDLNFPVEEYCATQGLLPPPPNAQLAIATPEKANSYVNGLFEENRISELGLVVVDEFHMVGEAGRGATLEVLLAKLLSWGKVQIVAMSATIANLEDLRRWLGADVFQADFRPVPLQEHVVFDGKIYLKNQQQEFNVIRELTPKVEATSKFPVQLIRDVLPVNSVIIFMATKKLTVEMARALASLPEGEALNVGGSSTELESVAQR